MFDAEVDQLPNGSWVVRVVGPEDIRSNVRIIGEGWEAILIRRSNGYWEGALPLQAVQFISAPEYGDGDDQGHSIGSTRVEPMDPGEIGCMVWLAVVRGGGVVYKIWV